MNTRPGGGRRHAAGPQWSNRWGKVSAAVCRAELTLPPRKSTHRSNDDDCNQPHQQAVFHRARARLIFEKILDPFHFVLSFWLLGFSVWFWVFPVNKLLNFRRKYSC